MYTRAEVKEIMDEAVKIARDYPFLPLTEAVKVAEEIYERKEKEPTADQSK